jgi:hypothetical protein
MTPHTLAIVVLGMLCGGCAEKSRLVDSEANHQPSRVYSVCDLPTIHAERKVDAVSIRGRLDLLGHRFGLRDDKCPAYALFFNDQRGDLDVSLCSYERLVKEFGCPGGNDNGPILTVTGVVSAPASANDEYSYISVVRMSDFENVRTGARYAIELAPNKSLERTRGR